MTKHDLRSFGGALSLKLDQQTRGKTEMCLNPYLKANYSERYLKQVTCPECGNEFDGELYLWESGDEECTECDHVFHVDATADEPIED